MVKSFQDYIVENTNEITFAFGRFNPPSIGHQKLLQAIIKKAKWLGAKPKLYVSYSHDSKKNPLTAKQKISYIRKMFPDETRQIDLKYNSRIKTILDVLVKLHGDYDKIVMIVGSDRVADFKRLLNKYTAQKNVLHRFTNMANFQENRKRKKFINRISKVSALTIFLKVSH